jgi:two-component system, LuxR family, response regulator FixJ
MSDNLNVYIVDDNPDWRDSLQWLFKSIGIAVQTYADAREFLDAYTPTDYGCLILDIRMPGMSGLELQRELMARTTRLHIIFVTGHASVPTAVRAMREGAADFFEKPVDEQVLLDRVQAVLRDIKTQREREMENLALKRALASLSARERQVLEYLLNGVSTREIAASLHISMRTIESHRSSILAKTDYSSMTDLLVRLKLKRAE